MPWGRLRFSAGIVMQLQPHSPLARSQLANIEELLNDFTTDENHNSVLNGFDFVLGFLDRWRNVQNLRAETEWLT